MLISYIIGALIIFILMKVKKKQLITRKTGIGSIPLGDANRNKGPAEMRVLFLSQFSMIAREDPSCGFGNYTGCCLKHLYTTGQTAVRVALLNRFYVVRIICQRID